MDGFGVIVNLKDVLSCKDPEGVLARMEVLDLW